MNTAASNLTVGEALLNTRRALADRSATPGIDAELLLRHVTGWSTAAMIVNADETLDPDLAQRFLELAGKRAGGEPVAYITGEREFWSMRFCVTPGTLIPRPDTETLVQLALDRIPNDSRTNVLDLGTGTGNIAVAIARARANAEVCAVDIDAETLAVAKRNARRLEATNVEFMLSDWFGSLAGRRFDTIVTNPPYVSADDPHLLDGDLRFEPRGALVSGKTGLEDIERIAINAPDFLVPRGRLLIEHGAGQGAAVRQMLKEIGYRDVATHTDLAGLERVTESLAGSR